MQIRGLLAYLLGLHTWFIRLLLVDFNSFADKGASIDTGVLGALAIGITVATLHNKYRKIELPAFLGFFGALVLFQLFHHLQQLRLAPFLYNLATDSEFAS